MDSKIIIAALNGNEEAFVQIYELTVNKAHRTAFSIVKDNDDALDVVQEAYISLWEKLSTLKNAEQFEAWFMQIVRNKALDFLKSTGRRVDGVTFSDVEAGGDEDFSLVDSVADERISVSPEASFDRAETQRILWDMVAQLPEKQALCIRLRFQENMKISEIAQATGLTESTVKSCLNYGQKKLAEAIKEQEKKGTKLYSLSPLALMLLLRFFLGGKTAASDVSKTTATAQAATAASTAVPAATQAVYTAAPAASAPASGGAAVASTVAKTAAKKGISAGAKAIIAALVATPIIAGGATVGGAAAGWWELPEFMEEIPFVQSFVEETRQKSISDYVVVGMEGEYEGNNHHIKYKIPQVTIAGEEAQELNEKINRDAATIVSLVDEVKNNKYQSIVGFLSGGTAKTSATYEGWLSGDNLTIAMDMEVLSYAEVTFYYSINVETGEVLQLEDVLGKTGMTQQQLFEYLSSEIRKDYERGMPGADPKMVAKTDLDSVTWENLTENNRMHLFYDRKGNLCAQCVIMVSGTWLQDVDTNFYGRTYTILPAP